MNTVDAIHQKVVDLPPDAQEEVLDAVMQIEQRYTALPETNGGNRRKHPLNTIAELATDVGIADLADRHDFYARRKLED